MLHCGFLVVLFYRTFDVVGSVSQSEINSHLHLGDQFLVKGQFQDALTHYHAAVDGDSSNYLGYYKRGTVYLALGKPKVALGDLDKVLELKPDFTAARVSRSTVLLKQAEFDSARDDANTVLSIDPYNEVANDVASKLEPIRYMALEAEELFVREQYDQAVEQLTSIIAVCPWAPRFRELRGEAYVAIGDYMSAISDMRLATKLVPDNDQGLYKLAILLYRLGHVDDSLNEIRNCLKLDPEHKQCLPLHRKIRKVAKKLSSASSSLESRELKNCVAAAKEILKYETTNDNVRFTAHHLLCQCYREDGEPTSAVKSCQEALKWRRDPVVLCDSAEAYLAAEMYDDAIREVKEALEIDSSSQRAKDLLEKSQKLQKISETRDYYKILGVTRTASKQEITKAYRKAAQTWHPDNFRDPEEKKKAEKKFIDIAAAKEVLTNDEKREKFDRGEDPLDPESGKHQSPFQEFHHFHGSPFQFKFHFN